MRKMMMKDRDETAGNAAEVRAALRRYAVNRRKIWQAGLGAVALTGGGAVAAAGSFARQGATPPAEATPGMDHSSMPSSGEGPGGHPNYMPGFAGEIDHE